jgi:hypothetical protein
MKGTSRVICCLVAVSFLATSALPASAETLMVLPLKGQSAQQQQKDSFECHQLAVAASGFDPNSVQADPSTGQGAMKGLVAGLVAGGIVAATGGAAAAVALTVGGGGLLGGIIGSNRRKKLEAANARYFNAAKVCMASRGYEVAT